MSSVYFGQARPLPPKESSLRSAIRRAVSSRQQVSSVLLGALLILTGGAGCASVFGVDEATCDSRFDRKCAAGNVDTEGETSGADTQESSGASSGESTSSSSSSADVTSAPPSEEVVLEACEDYCADVLQGCAEDAPQFTTESGCMTICQNMYRFDDTKDGESANTLQCRASAARIAVDFSDGREQTCVSAGPMGPGCGGTACDNYCDAMERFCPEEFEKIADCEDLCRSIPRIEPYTDDFDGSNSLECRVYHIQLSVKNSPQRLVHCGHAAGKGEVCVDPAPEP